MSNRILANLMPYEGTVTGELIITFPIKAKTLAVYNKSGSKAMTICFNPTETVMTLDPTEIIEFPEISIRTVLLNGAGVEYKVVALG